LSPLAGKIGLCFAWSASKSFAQYGARVGALVVVDPDADRRKRAVDALAFACRGTWSNCNHAGMLAITRILTEAPLRARVDGERAKLKALLDARVHAFNARAEGTGLVYPRYDGGFFTTVLAKPGADVQAMAKELRAIGIFVVPQGPGLRVALCSVAERDVARLVEGLAKVMA
jgi:aromatic-amino-acid transaminase